MLGLMRLAKEIYWVYQEKFGASNISNIRIPVDGIYVDLDDLPSSYVQEALGCSKEDLYKMIIEEVDSTEFKESLNDL